MRPIYLLIAFVMWASAATAFGQGSWLDRPIDRNWNDGNGVVPNAPRNSAPIDQMCRETIRTPESLADRAVTRAGWFLYGPAQVYGNVTLVTAMAGTDGMCRPNDYNAFVFVANRFAGTLAPTPSGARADGSLGLARLLSPTSVYAEYSRYTSNDALCCPSQSTRVDYSITTGPRAVVKADDLRTEQNCSTDGRMETQDNVVSGTVTYRQRSALPPTAVLTVKIVDVSRQDVSGTVVAEQRIDTAGKQVPIPFDIAYDRTKIQERSRYAVQAEIRDGSRLLFITETSYPVITQGNPRSVDVTVVPVGGGGGGAVRSGVIRGTVTYLQRSALPQNSEVKVRLVDSSEPNGTPIAETTFSSGSRQVPIPFELRFEPRDVSRQRSYELQAEIKSEGRVIFRTESGKGIGFRGAGQTENVEIIVVPAGPESITGRSLSLSKFGTGSIKIGTRPAQFLVRGNVTVRSDGTAEVAVSGLEGTTTFSGKLTFFDEAALRITVENSGDASAGGEIEVRYSGRSLRSLAGTNLTLDGQDVVLRF